MIFQFTASIAETSCIRNEKYCVKDLAQINPSRRTIDSRGFPSAGRIIRDTRYKNRLQFISFPRGSSASALEENTRWEMSSNYAVELCSFNRLAPKKAASSPCSVVFLAGVYPSQISSHRWKGRAHLQIIMRVMKIYLWHYSIIHPAAVEYRASLPIHMIHTEGVPKTAVNEPRSSGGALYMKFYLAPTRASIDIHS